MACRSPSLVMGGPSRRADRQVISTFEIASGSNRATFQSDSGTVMALLFSPNCKTLISGHVTSTALRWDLTGLGPKRQQRNKALSADDLGKEWQHLGGNDARRAYQALWILAATDKQAVTKAREELRPAKAVDDNKIAQWFIDLEADRAAVREKAVEELTKAGDQAWPALRDVFAGTSRLETKTQARRLLELGPSPTPHGCGLFGRSCSSTSTTRKPTNCLKACPTALRGPG